MTGTLRDTIQVLAADFAAGVLGVIRGASLEEILAETGTAPATARRGRPSSPVAVSSPASRAPSATRSRPARSGRLQRRSASDIGQVVEEIVALLATKPKGLRAEEIRASLGLSSKELPRPIAQALSAKQITKTGQKRATTYFAKAAGGATASGKGGREKAPSKADRKGAKRSARPSKAARAVSSAKAAPRASEVAEAGPAEGT